MRSPLYQSLTSLFKNRKRITLYEKLGGEPAIDATVEIFYRKILADDALKDFFQGICMHYQLYKQKVFLTMVLGGPIRFTGKELRDAHRRLVQDQGLNDSHFDRVIEHLRVTLEELNVETEDIEQVISIAESNRNDVLCR
jgi:hemoglobin